MPLLPLDKRVLLVVFLENSEALNITNVKVNDNGVRVLLGEVTKPAEHLRHDLPLRV